MRNISRFHLHSCAKWNVQTYFIKVYQRLQKYFAPYPLHIHSIRHSPAIVLAFYVFVRLEREIFGRRINIKWRDKNYSFFCAVIFPLFDFDIKLMIICWWWDNVRSAFFVVLFGVIVCLRWISAEMQHQRRQSTLALKIERVCGTGGETKR